MDCLATVCFEFVPALAKGTHMPGFGGGACPLANSAQLISTTKAAAVQAP